jgi:HD-GYP domain-containing protein (c-di-GMP phosphodiesterase class II)
MAHSVIEGGYPSLVLHRLARQTCEVVDVDGSSILLRDPDRRDTAIAVAGCGDDEELVGSRFQIERSFIGSVLESGRTLVSPASHAASRLNRHSSAARMSAAAALPDGGRILGALGANHHGSRRFGRRELALLSDLAEVVAPALAHAARRTEQLPSLKARIDQLIRAIDEHDGYTAGHSEAVVDLSCSLGERLGLELPALFELELAALFHDLGKIGLPESILKKPGPLDEEEHALMQRHPIWGADLLRRVKGLEPVATIVRFHHERWDGTGYPHGLEGEHIPLASRIVAVCDAYDAMTSDRSYRSALAPEQAVAELREHAGSQFDPNVVDRFIAVLGEDDPPRRRETAHAYAG